MADAMGAVHLGKIEAASHIFRETNLLENLDTVARAHHLHLGAEVGQRTAGCVDLRQRHFDHGMGGLHQHGNRLADRGVQVAVKALEVQIRLRRLDRDLPQAILRPGIDRNPR